MEPRGGALERLRQAADAFLAEAPCVRGDIYQLIDYLEPVRVEINRLELGFAMVCGRLPEACHEAVYYTSPIQALRHQCHMASGAAAAAIGVGEHLDRLPSSVAALDAGRIGFAHLNLLAQTAEFVGEGFTEQPLLTKAEENPVTPFARICSHARHAACPEKFAEQERRAHEDRLLEMSTRSEDGWLFLRGWLDAEGGAYVRTAIEGLSQPLPDDDRLVGQRRADALVEIAKLSLDEGQAPERGGVRPHVQVTATLETLLGLPGAPAAELEGSGPISVEMLRRIAGDCSVRRLLLDEDSLVIDVGRERRLFRGGTRLALERRDKGCVWPGCSRPARLCQADHVVPWIEGGESNADNGRLLCRYHHRLRSEGWQLLRAEDQWVVKPPIWTIWSRAG